MRTSVISLVLAVACAAALWGSAEAEVIPAQGFAMIDGQGFALPAVQVGKTSVVGSAGAPVTFRTGAGDELRLFVRASTDPFVTYGLTVLDFGAPSLFGFVFTTPIVPVGTPNIMTASVSGALTDAAGDGVSITPTVADQDGDLLVELQVGNLSAPLTNAGVDVGPAVAGSGAFGPFTAGPAAGPGPGPWTMLTAAAFFQLSGGSDTAALNGTVSITPGGVAVPGPDSLFLLGSGVAAAAAFARRRKRNPLQPPLPR